MGKLKFFYKVFLTGLICTSAFVFSAHSQSMVTHTNEVWFSYNNTVTFNKKFSLLSDAQLRTKNFFGEWYQLALRTSVGYSFNSRWIATAGFAWFKNVQYVGLTPLFKNEFRPAEDISYKSKLLRGVFTQRLRGEERFLQQVVNNKLSSEYDFVFRLRYHFDDMFSLKNPKWAIGFGYEIMVNPQYSKGPRFFDQDRIFLLFNRIISPSLTLQASVMEIIQGKGKVDTYDDQNVFRLRFYHRLGKK